ncbi:MAG TPA: sigma-70 family RNA polymerase sigma factor [Tepidisphaeraceae bacterium]|nr:sigma-70 family RNA polymerase sigma factor [Tepidisphaeraceae bacterium]
MAGVRAGDAEAMAALYEQYSTLVYSVCLRALHDCSDAEDLVVEIFSELWERGDRFDPSRGSPLGHIMGLTRSRVVDRLRSRRSAHRGGQAIIGGVEAADGMHEPVAGPLEDAMTAERRGLVIHAMKSLPADQLAALELAFFEGMSHAQVAERLGQPLGTIKSRIRQALLYLRDLLGSQD